MRIGNTFIHWGLGRLERQPTTKMLRQQVQLHPENALAHYHLSDRLHGENVLQERLHTRFRQEWTLDDVSLWHERKDEAILEMKEAIDLFCSDPMRPSEQENTRYRAVAHFSLGSWLLRDGLQEQARTEWESCLKIATGDLARYAQVTLIKLNKDK